jgi:hypothetical protein
LKRITHPVLYLGSNITMDNALSSPYAQPADAALPGSQMVDRDYGSILHSLRLYI